MINIANTMLCCTQEGDSVSLSLVQVTGGMWVAAIEGLTGHDSPYTIPLFSADPALVTLVAKGDTPSMALANLEQVCSRPEHLRAMGFEFG